MTPHSLFVCVCCVCVGVPILMLKPSSLTLHTLSHTNTHQRSLTNTPPHTRTTPYHYVCRRVCAHLMVVVVRVVKRHGWNRSHISSENFESINLLLKYQKHCTCVYTYSTINNCTVGTQIYRNTVDLYKLVLLNRTPQGQS